MNPKPRWASYIFAHLGVDQAFNDEAVTGH
jgi:hypothetical protein